MDATATTANIQNARDEALLGLALEKQSPATLDLVQPMIPRSTNR